MKKIISFLSITIILLLAAGCLVQSLSPYYTDENKIPMPESLKGYWELVKEQGEKRDNITPWIIKDGIMTVYDENNVSGRLKIVFFKVGENLYSDTIAETPEENKVNQIWLQHTMPMHILCKVINSGDDLQFIPISYKWIDEAIKEKKLALSYVEHPSEDNWPLFTAPAKDWEKFLTRHGNDQEVFSPKLAYVLKRLKKTPAK